MTCTYEVCCQHALVGTAKATEDSDLEVSVVDILGTSSVGPCTQRGPLVLETIVITVVVGPRCQLIFRF